MMLSPDSILHKVLEVGASADEDAEAARHEWSDNVAESCVVEIMALEEELVDKLAFVEHLSEVPPKVRGSEPSSELVNSIGQASGEL